MSDDPLAAELRQSISAVESWLDSLPLQKAGLSRLRDLRALVVRVAQQAETIATLTRERDDARAELARARTERITRGPHAALDGDDAAALDQHLDGRWRQE